MIPLQIRQKSDTPLIHPDNWNLTGKHSHRTKHTPVTAENNNQIRRKQRI